MNVSDVCLSTLLLLPWLAGVVRACKDHRVCKYYEKYKDYYCRHQWLVENCAKMCGLCAPVCQHEDHIACLDYGIKPEFYCPHSWLRENCNQMCGRCANEELRWPEGEYGILSHEECPPKWFEFNHCMDSENDNNKDDHSEFLLSPNFGCERTSLSFRYCFKGPKVPTRKGGFWTKRNFETDAYVVRGVSGSCSVYGSDGGIVEIDNEDYRNKNNYGNHGLNGARHFNFYPYDFIFEHYSRTRLSFCKIGGKGEKASSSDYIEVGNFNNQKFGFFVTPSQKCPTIKSPQGILYGRKQKFFSDDENYMCRSRIIDGAPPVLLRSDGSRWAACQYDPNEAKTY